MVPLLFAAYMESRAPGTTPVPPPVPIVQVHEDVAQQITERLADSLDVGSALTDAAHRPPAAWAAGTVSAARYAGPRSETEPGGWAQFACALFSQIS